MEFDWYVIRSVVQLPLNIVSHIIYYLTPLRSAKCYLTGSDRHHRDRTTPDPSINYYLKRENSSKTFLNIKKSPVIVKNK